jgi:hypothetical protein
MAWKAGGEAGLPLASRGREWDGDEARERIFKWAGGDKLDPKKARQAFFAYDDTEPENRPLTSSPSLM